MNIDKDLTDMYILGLKQINSGFYHSVEATKNLILDTAKLFPDYQVIANNYIKHLDEMKESKVKNHD